MTCSRKTLLMWDQIGQFPITMPAECFSGPRLPDRRTFPMNSYIVIVILLIIRVPFEIRSPQDQP